MAVRPRTRSRACSPTNDFRWSPDSLPVASLFSDVGNVETIVTGGSLYRRLGTLVGPLCEKSFDEVHADIAVVGGAGITEKGIWSHNALIAAAQRKMIAAAETNVFALDKSKFGRTASVSRHPLTLDSPS